MVGLLAVLSLLSYLDRQLLPPIPLPSIRHGTRILTDTELGFCLTGLAFALFYSVMPCCWPWWWTAIPAVSP